MDTCQDKEALLQELGIAPLLSRHLLLPRLLISIIIIK